MKTNYRTLFAITVLSLLLHFLASGCASISRESSYTLGSGSRVAGTLLLLGNNAILEPGSSVDGSVLMLCCNLRVEGTVARDVFLLTGNLRLDSLAEVGGQVRVISGNLSR